MRRNPRSAFTLVEILIVVVILGVLAAIATAQFTNIAADTSHTTAYSELQKIRRHIGVFQARHEGRLPTVTAGDGTWGELVSRDHFMSAPVNAWTGGVNGHVIVIGTAADTTYHQNYGWIYDDTTGNVWAAGFDADDKPLPR